MTKRYVTYIGAWLLVAACSSTSEPTDAGEGHHDGAPRSMPAQDADTSEPSDAAARDDATTLNDAATWGDAAADGGRPQDAASVLDGALADDAGGSCVGACLRWPVAGVRGVDWVINNYVDLATDSPALEDYTGHRGDLARTYDGHRGVDIDIANFRAMDRGVDVVASTAGVVSRIVQGEMDRNISCVTTDWNVVHVDGDDGLVYFYGHLRRDSVVVSIGDRVVAGQRLAEVGSSGCSTAPHLHFEVRRSVGGASIDPFLMGMWADAPSYDDDYRILDISLRAGFYADGNELKDPGSDVMVMTAGGRLGVGISSADGRVDDRLNIVLRRPSGTMFDTYTITRSAAGRHSWWYWNRTIGMEPGRWSVEVSTDVDRVTRELMVR